MSLARVALHTPVRVCGVSGNSPLSYRLMEMGFIDGVEAEVIGRAPFGDPLRVRLGEYSLSLRSSEAELVDVATVE